MEQFGKRSTIKKIRTPSFRLSNHMRLPPGLGNVQGVNDMPVLQTVLDDPPVEGVLVAAVSSPEVSVACVVGLLIGRHVAQHLLKLQETKNTIH